MKKYDTLNKVLTESLKSRLDCLEANYFKHSKRIEESQTLLDYMNSTANYLNTKEQSTIFSTNPNDLSKSFISTTSKSNFNKSRISEKGRNKTPFKSNTKTNLHEKSSEKDRKSVIRKATTNTNLLSVNKFSAKALTNTKSTLNLNKHQRGVSEDKGRRNPSQLSKTPLNTDISPANKKFNLKTPTNINNINTFSPKNKSAVKLKPFEPITSLTSNILVNSESKTKENVRNFNKVQLNIKETGMNKKNDHCINEFEKDFNVSKIITLDGGLHDDSLINAKDELLINYEMAELELSSKRNFIDTPVTSTQHLIDKEIVLDYEDVLEDKWTMFIKYLSTSDQIKLLKINKKFGRYTILKFIANLESERQSYEEKILGVQTPSKEAEIIVFSRGSTKAVDLLNEKLYSQAFLSSTLPCDDILKVYKILFTYLGHPNSKLTDKNLFWRETCNYFIKESDVKSSKIIFNY